MIAGAPMSTWIERLFGTRKPAQRPDVRPARPVWPLIVTLMGPAFLLQLIPVLNLLLVFLLSPLWIAALLNVALVTMVLDVRRGAAPRWLLAVPIAVYGGSLAYSAISYVQYRLLDARLHRENAAQRLAFDPARMDLVAPGRLAQGVLYGHAIPTAYTDARGLRGDGVPVSLRILPPAVCDTIPRSPDFRMSVSTVGFELPDLANACMLSLPGDPERPAVFVKRDPQFPQDTPRTRLTLTAPDGAAVTLVHGRHGVALPLPLPFVACLTWSKLDCKAEWIRLPLAVGGRDEDEAAMIAAALGLKPRISQLVKGRNPLDASLVLDEAQTEALAAGSEPAVAEARAYGGKVVDTALARFRSLLAGQALARGEIFDSWIVASNADKLDGEAGALLAAIERDLADPDRTASMRVYGEVAAALPPETFDRIGPGLAEMVGADETLRTSRGLVIRLGDLGEPAVPVLIGMLEADRSREVRIDAALGLCRAGRKARDVADRVARSGRANMDSDATEALVLALMRMDRPDLARALAAPTGEGRDGKGRARPAPSRVQTALAEVDAASPPSACLRGGFANRLPDLPWLD